MINKCALCGGPRPRHMKLYCGLKCRQKAERQCQVPTTTGKNIESAEPPVSAFAAVNPQNEPSASVAASTRVKRRGSPGAEPAGRGLLSYAMLPESEPSRVSVRPVAKTRTQMVGQAARIAFVRIVKGVGSPLLKASALVAESETRCRATFNAISAFSTRGLASARTEAAVTVGFAATLLRSVPSSASRALRTRSSTRRCRLARVANIFTQRVKSSVSTVRKATDAE